MVLSTFKKETHAFCYMQYTYLSNMSLVSLSSLIVVTSLGESPQACEIKRPHFRFQILAQGYDETNHINKLRSSGSLKVYVLSTIKKC